MTDSGAPATENAAPDPLTAPCPFCEAKPGQRCMAVCDWARKPHAARRKLALALALALAAHADPLLDAHFPKLGPCGICNVPGLDQRHRVIDAIADGLGAGEDAEDLAAEFGVPREAVAAAGAWAARWPGASA